VEPDIDRRALRIFKLKIVMPPVADQKQASLRCDHIMIEARTTERAGAKQTVRAGRVIGRQRGIPANFIEHAHVSFLLATDQAIENLLRKTEILWSAVARWSA
jgi:hypothetical protein